MKALIEYIIEHTERGECQCGKCFDKGPERPAPIHSVNVHFFWVSARNEPTAGELLTLLKWEYPNFERLKEGPSFIEIGGEMGDQGLALLLIGLGTLLKIWGVITPETLGVDGEMASQLAGSGLVMTSGLREAA